jgi:hypothetical protein
MSKLAKRAVIAGAALGLVLLAGIGIVAFKAAKTLTSSSSAQNAAAFSAQLSLPAPLAPREAPASAPEPAVPAPVADLANAFGAALGVDVKKSGVPRGAAPNAASAPASSPADTLDLGPKKEREARFGGHDTDPAAIRVVGSQQREKAAAGEALTFETQLK